MSKPSSKKKKSGCDHRSNADGRVADAQSFGVSLGYNFKRVGDPAEWKARQYEPTTSTWWFNSRCLPSVGGPLTDAELNHRPLPERVVQHLVDALFRFYELYASTNSPRTETMCVESAASIYGILRNNGIEVVIF